MQYFRLLQFNDTSLTNYLYRSNPYRAVRYSQQDKATLSYPAGAGGVADRVYSRITRHRSAAGHGVFSFFAPIAVQSGMEYVVAGFQVCHPAYLATGCRAGTSYHIGGGSSSPLLPGNGMAGGLCAGSHCLSS